MPLAEPQPEGVQAVEGVGLVVCGFQFFTSFASVFAEEGRDYYSYFRFICRFVYLYKIFSLV